MTGLCIHLPANTPADADTADNKFHIPPNYPGEIVAVHPVWEHGLQIGCKYGDYALLLPLFQHRQHWEGQPDH